jgi:hypothetical protein
VAMNINAVGTMPLCCLFKIHKKARCHHE